MYRNEDPSETTGTLVFLALLAGTYLTAIGFPRAQEGIAMQRGTALVQAQVVGFRPEQRSYKNRQRVTRPRQVKVSYPWKGTPHTSGYFEGYEEVGAVTPIYVSLTHPNFITRDPHASLAGRNTGIAMFGVGVLLLGGLVIYSVRAMDRLFLRPGRW